MKKSAKKDFEPKARKPKAPKKPKAKFLIFSDLDGVLTNFDEHAKKHNKLDAKGNPKWDEMDYAWWSSMPGYDGAKDFYDALRERGRTRMLTAPIMNSGSFQGKAEWTKEFRRNRFGLLDLMIAKADDKKLLARPHHILVDDRQKNIDEWIEAGGIGILHKGDYADTLKRVDEAMAKYELENDPSLPPPPPFYEKGALKVFIGTNGVLTDFQGHLEAHDKIDDKGKTKWTELDKEWWKNIPLYDGAKDFYDSVREAAKDPETGKSQVRFLTGPVPSPDSFGGNAEWTMKFRGKFGLTDILIARSKDKMLFARPNNILIDDREANVKAWRDAGGIAVHHKGDFAETLKEVQEAIAEIRKPPTRRILPMKKPKP